VPSISLYREDSCPSCAVQNRSRSHIPSFQSVIGSGVIAPRRSNSAHLHRPRLLSPWYLHLCLVYRGRKYLRCPSCSPLRARPVATSVSKTSETRSRRLAVFLPSNTLEIASGAVGAKALARRSRTSLICSRPSVGHFGRSVTSGNSMSNVPICSSAGFGAFTSSLGIW
jgi:hypothetical protein